MAIITEKQQQILETIRQAIDQQGYAPTVREIGSLVGLSSSCTVKKHIDKLIEKGHLARDRYNRNIVLMEHGQPVAPSRAVTVPLIGRVAGGRPTLASQEHNPERIPLPLSLLRGKKGSEDLFALEVFGNSMQGVGIGNGDIVVVQRQQSAEDGDIVVALLDDEATVKTFYQEKQGIRLQPENPEFDPIITQDAQILGKVAMAIKRFA